MILKFCYKIFYAFPSFFCLVLYFRKMVPSICFVLIDSNLLDSQRKIHNVKAIYLIILCMSEFVNHIFFSSVKVISQDFNVLF